MRLFAGAFPPTDAIEKLSHLTDEMKSKYSAGAFVKPEKHHLTVRFFGDVLIDEAARAIDSAVVREPEFQIVLDHVSAFPAPRSARVLFCGLANPATLESLMTRAGEARAHAHLTLARFRSPQSIDEEAISPISFSVDKVVLVNSVLGQDSRYEIVREWQLA